MKHSATKPSNIRTNALTHGAAAVLLALGASAASAASGVALSGYDAQEGLRAKAAVTSNVTTPATTYNYYVSPTGSDTAAGTKAKPFKTLARAAKAATKPGTTVFVAPGTYEGGFKTTASGTAAARI